MTVRYNTVSRCHIPFGLLLEESARYSAAVIDGDWVFVSGTTGYDYSSMSIAEDVQEQTCQALRNIQRVLLEAGTSLEDVVRIKYYLTDIDDFAKVRPIISQFSGKARPSATAIIRESADPKMKIEIEVTARLQRWSKKTA